MRVLAIGVVMALLPETAHGSPRLEKVHLRYTATRTCPNEDTFIAALRRDTEAFELVGADEARRLVDVDLQARAGGARGRFRFVDRTHGTTIERELAGPDCEAVGRALALMLALAMHRVSSSEERAVPDEASEKAVVVVAPAPERRPGPTDVPPAPNPAPSRGAAPKSLDVSLDVQAAVTRAVVADLLPYGALTVHLEPTQWRLRPSIAIGVRQSLPRDVAIAGGATSFLWTAGALRLCPHRFALGSFTLAPCLEGALGAVRAEATGLPSSRRSVRAWREGSALVEARWNFTRHWFATATVTLTVPLTRSRFELSSGELISQAPLIGFAGGIGVGLSL